MGCRQAECDLWAAHDGCDFFYVAMYIGATLISCKLWHRMGCQKGSFATTTFRVRGLYGLPNFGTRARTGLPVTLPLSAACDGTERDDVDG